MKVRKKAKASEYERLMEEGYKFYAEDNLEFAEWAIQFAQDWLEPYESPVRKVRKLPRNPKP